MKRTVFTVALLLLVGFLASNKLMAQEGAKVGFRLSPNVAWSSVVGDSSKQKPAGLTTKAGAGFAFDFVFTYGFSDKIAFKTGINICKKNVSSVFDLPLSTTVQQKVGLTSVEVPLGLKFRSPEIGSGLFIIGMFGVTPEINFANKVVTTTTVGGTQLSQVEERDVNSINLITGSFSPGAGVDWEFDWGMLEMGLTYNLGLMSYTNKKDTGYSSKISYIALNLGYFF